MGRMAFPENMEKISRTVMSFGADSARESFIFPYGKNQYKREDLR